MTTFSFGKKKKKQQRIQGYEGKRSLYGVYALRDTRSPPPLENLQEEKKILRHPLLFVFSTPPLPFSTSSFQRLILIFDAILRNEFSHGLNVLSMLTNAAKLKACCYPQDCLRSSSSLTNFLVM